MVETRSASRSATRGESHGSREPQFVPREHVEVHTTGIAIIDHFLEQDCVLTPKELASLAAHEYSAVDVSWLDELCMKAFWEWVVEFCPLWLAPNLITLIGLVINLVTVLVLSHYSPKAVETAPRWAYALAALGLFVYQTLDAIDGKQARRTRSASPLGELFDHGCDSVSQVFVSLNVCYALQLGTIQHAVFFMCILSATVFYTAHWSTYCTGQLRFARFDVTEAQMAVICMLLATTLFGPEIWSLGVFNFTLKHLFLLCAFIGAFYQLSSYFHTILTGGIGRSGSTVAGTSIVSPLLPLMSAIVPFCMMYSKSTSTVFSDNITIFVLFFGAVAAKATDRLIIAHMSRSQLIYWDWTYVGPAAMILNQYYDIVFSEERLLFICTTYSTLLLFLYCSMVTRQICAYLHINCFSIKKTR